MRSPFAGAVAVLLAAATLTAACAPSPGDRAPRSPEAALGDSLVDAWISAAGGLETWWEVESARYTVTTVWYDSVGEIRRMRPRRVELRKVSGGEQSRIERPEAEGLYVQVFAGDTAWATLNEAALPEDHPATVESEYVGRDVFYWFGLPYKLRDPGVNRRARALAEGGYELAVTFGDEVGAHPGDRYFYYFLDDDPQPEEVHYIEQERGEEDRNRTVWSGVGRAGRLSYVVSRLYLNSEEQRTKELRIDDVTINPELPDSLFAAPRR
jgi:hypothetical protein